MEKINIERLNETVYVHTLPSKLKIFIWPYQMASDIYLTLTIKYGSIDSSFENTLNNS